MRRREHLGHPRGSPPTQHQGPPSPVRGRPAGDTSPCDYSPAASSPLLPAEVVVAPEDQEEAENSGEDDCVSCENECACSPLDLRQEERHGQPARKVQAPRSQSMLCAFSQS